eukprot:UN02321
MILQPEDLNTDGIDISGSNFWVHNVHVSNDDDSVVVKPCRKGSCGISRRRLVNGDDIPCSMNMLIENSTLIGFGATIGSVPASSPPNCVHNITFRNTDMPKTGKGIYIESNPECKR